MSDGPVIMWVGSDRVMDERALDGSLPAYLHGYPVLYVTGDGDTLCAACVGKLGPDDPTVWVAPFWKGGPEECADCGAPIESAYGPTGSGGADDPW